LFKRPSLLAAAVQSALLLAVTACAPAAPSQPAIQAPNQMIVLPGGLEYTDIKVGDGASAAAGQKLT
jgi:FKBP-type peptidyl-prolyl cis-trans isomerase